MASSFTDFLSTYGEVILLAVVSLVLVLKGVFGKSLSRLWSSEDEPLLLASGILSSASLQSATQGQVAGYTYNLLSDDSGRVTVLVTLGSTASTHILAYGDKDNDVDLRPPKKWLHQVSLEGDFPRYFHLYCTPGKEIELLQIFEPETMAHFIDFCRAYNLEIFKESIYISQAGGSRDQNDTTTMFTDIEQFLRENSAVLNRL
jgi:hypothetical protein